MKANRWVCDRAVDLLRDDPQMDPKGLQDELKKKYSVDVPYHRVFRGKMRALDIIYGKWEDWYDSGKRSSPTRRVFCSCSNSLHYSVGSVSWIRWQRSVLTLFELLWS